MQAYCQELSFEYVIKLLFSHLKRCSNESASSAPDIINPAVLKFFVELVIFLILLD
jgi:hypothetical protein